MMNKTKPGSFNSLYQSLLSKLVVKISVLLLLGGHFDRAAGLK